MAQLRATVTKMMAEATSDGGPIHNLMAYTSPTLSTYRATPGGLWPGDKEEAIWNDWVNKMNKYSMMLSLQARHMILYWSNEAKKKNKLTSEP